MRQTFGLSVNDFNLELSELVGTLLFKEFPITFVYSDSAGEPIMKEWVDVNDNGDVDRFFYYRTTKFLLKQFIEKKLSHQQLINSPVDGLLYFTDERQQTILTVFAIPPLQLPPDYKPDSNFYLKESDWVDVTSIDDYFELSKLADNYESAAFKSISTISKSETVNLHLLEGKGVGYGAIEPEVLGRTLIRFKKLYEDIALDSLKGKDRGTLPDKEKGKLLPLYETEVYTQIAASFGILIRPKISNYSIDNRTSFEIIVKKTFDLINKGEDIELFKEEYINHSTFTIGSLRDFMDDIYALELNIGFNWYNPKTNDQLQESLSFQKANTIITNIKTLSASRTESIERNGKFRGVYLNTGHFIFESTDGEQFTGYFDDLLKEGSQQINFIDVYSIKISRRITTEAGRQDERVADTIVSFYRVE